MGHKFADIMFTQQVQEVQKRQGSYSGYHAWNDLPDHNQILSKRERDFIAARDSFYMASVSETGWPYIQHRGGPLGFMKVLDEQTLGFADFSGNRQYISTGNFQTNDRVSLFFMDYPNRLRLKLLGRVAIVPESDIATLAELETEGYRAPAERGFMIKVEAYDWNCPQHITPRFSQNQVDEQLAALRDEIQSLQAQQISKPMDSLGSGSLALDITSIRQLAENIRAYELRHPEGLPLPKVTAGSHLKIPLPIVGSSDTRHYSICSNPARTDAYEIAVLREPQGFGSQAIHQRFTLNQRIHVELPTNNFELDKAEHPAVFIAGGIGITPIKAMAQEATSRGLDIYIHYAGKSKQKMAFSDRLQREFGDQLSLYSGEEGQRMDLNQIFIKLDEQAVVYCCGPERLIAAVEEQMQRHNIDPERVRFELFNAPRADNQPLEVYLKRSDLNLHVPSDKTILEVMLAAQIDAPHSCRAGNCKTCAVTALEGEVLHRDHCLSDDEKEQKLFCPCVSRATSDQLTLDI